MLTEHLVLRFDPSGSPIAASDAGTLHIPIIKGFMGYKNIFIKNIKATVRTLQAEAPIVNPVMGFFLSKGLTVDPSSQSFGLWNASDNFQNGEVFYHNIFSILPENAVPQNYDSPGIEIDFNRGIMASLTIDNQDSINQYNKVVRVHLTIGYDFKSAFSWRP